MKVVKLGEIGKIITGCTPSTKKSEYYASNDYMFVGPSDIKNVMYVVSSEKHISEKAYEDYKTRFINENSIVVDCIGSDMGNVAIIKEKCLTNQQINAITNIDESNYNIRYVYYVLSTMKNYFHLIGTNGSTMPILNKTMFENIEIEVPDIETQDKIANVLSKLDDKIKLNNEINNNLQELINNIFISKFVNYYGYTGEYETTEIGDIPSNWKVDNLGNVISFSNGYGWNSKDMLENNQPDTYKVFKMGNIKIGGGINKEKTRSWILKEKCSGLEQFLSKKGDILMCMTDMKSSENPLLGHTALIDCDDEFVINQRVGIIRCDKDIRWPYIYTMTNLPFFINNIRSKAHSGVQVNLTTAGICDTKVLIPDKDSLEEFYKNVTPMYEEMFILNNEIEKLEELRDTLLPKLMNGEIDLDNIEI